MVLNYETTEGELEFVCQDIQGETLIAIFDSANELLKEYDYSDFQDFVDSKGGREAFDDVWNQSTDAHSTIHYTLSWQQFYDSNQSIDMFQDFCNDKIKTIQNGYANIKK